MGAGEPRVLCDWAVFEYLPKGVIYKASTSYCAPR